MSKRVRTKTLDLTLHLKLRQRFMWSIVGQDPSSFQVSWKSAQFSCNTADKTTNQHM